jgi:tight adherence protein B
VLHAVPGLLETVVEELRSGGSVVGALDRVASHPGPLALDAARVAARCAAGHPLIEALAIWRCERPEIGVVAGALELAVELGGRCAGPLEALAASFRDRLDIERETRALSAQARLSAVVVGGAPPALLGCSTVLDGRVATALLGTGAGRACLVAGLGLEGLAAAWMARILRQVQP